MSNLGSLLLVLAAQVTLPVLGGLLLSRRRDPAAACAPLVLAALAALALTPLTLAPLPQWKVAGVRPVESIAPAAIESKSENATAAAAPGIDLLLLFRLPKPAPATHPHAAIDGWRIAAGFAIGLAAFGLVRFAFALATTIRVVRGSRPLDCEELQSLVAELSQAIRCRRPIALRESDRVGSAATAGWRRPIVLVSPAWRTWSPAERRAVLAHEIAHVVRGDYQSRLITQLAAALHAYHPLIRWLARRLELRQEMAADALAARSCGGRSAYLKCLASLALKADAGPVGFVPTFLSRPRNLLRRIAMLRVKDDTATRSRRWPALAAIGCLAGIAMGIRGTTPESLAGPIVPARFVDKKDRPPLEVSCILPSDSKDEIGVFALRVGELCRTPGFDKLAEKYTAMLPALFGGKKVQLALADIEQIAGRVSLSHDPKKPAPNHSLSMSLTSVRMAKDFDWLTQLRELCSDWKEHSYKDVKYYSGKASIPSLGFKDATVYFYLPDSRTAVLESEANIKTLIDRKGKTAKPEWAADWHKVEGGTLAMMLPDLKSKLANKLSADQIKDKTEAAAVKAVATVCAKARRAAIGVDLTDRCMIRLRLVCANADDAADVDSGCQAIAKLAMASIGKDKDAANERAEPGQQEPQVAIGQRHRIQEGGRPRRRSVDDLEDRFSRIAQGHGRRSDCQVIGIERRRTRVDARLHSWSSPTQSRNRAGLEIVAGNAG